MAMTYEQAKAEFARQNPQRPDLVKPQPQVQVAQVPQAPYKSQLAPAPTLAEKPLTDVERARVDAVGDTPKNVSPGMVINHVGKGVVKGLTDAGSAAYHYVTDPVVKFGNELVTGTPYQPPKPTTASTETPAPSPSKVTPEITEPSWKQQPTTNGNIRLTQYGGQGQGDVEITPNSASGLRPSNPRPDNRPDSALSMVELGNRNIRSGNIGGGTLSVTQGPGRSMVRSDDEWNALSPGQRSQMNVNAYNQAAEGEALRNKQRIAAMDGRRLDESGNIAGTEGGPLVIGESGGRGVLDKGHNDARSARMQFQNDLGDVERRYGRSAAKQFIAANEQGKGGMSAGDLIGLTKLQQDQAQFNATDARERQKMGLDLARWDREQQGVAATRADSSALKKAQIAKMEREGSNEQAAAIDTSFDKSATLSSAPEELRPYLHQWTSNLAGSMPASSAASKVEAALAGALAEDRMTLKDLPNLNQEAKDSLYKRLQARLGRLE